MNNETYNVWYNCYVDLFNNQGLAVGVIQYTDHYVFFSHFKHNCTINEMNLMGIMFALNRIPDKQDVCINGNSKYSDMALKKLKQWIQKDEIDLKSHSHILKQIWENLIRFDRVSSQYHYSRSADPMLWSTSLLTKSLYRCIQEVAIESGKYPENDTRESHSLTKSEFLDYCNSLPKPLTELQMENRIRKQRELKSPIEYPENVIPLPR